MTKKIKQVIDGPVNLVGMIGRIVEFEDGTGRVETWGGPSKGWVPGGGADGAEIVRAAPALQERLIRYKVPEEDWPPAMLEDWRRKQQSKQK